MSDSPIFDQLFSERAGSKTHEQFFKFPASVFRWPGSPKGVKLGKQYTIAKGFSMELPESVQKPALIRTWLPTPEPDESVTGLLEEFRTEVIKHVAEVYPDSVITRVGVKPNMDDNTLSLVVEGLHPTVKPLSARDTAEPME